MAKVKCEYCGNFMMDTDEVCPNCGAVNVNHQRTASDTPRTIEELKDWYKARNLPPEEVTRFFIGKNITEPKAFGIYEENGSFIVYKNKADGSRAIRYEGTDEAYAVNELYLRLKEEILNQKSHNALKRSAGKSGSGNNTSKNKGFRGKLLSFLTRPFVLTFIIALIPISILFGSYGSYAYKESQEPQEYNYYLDEDGTPYYYIKSWTNGLSCEWWRYNDEAEDWELYQSFDDDSEFPEELSSKSRHYGYVGDMLEELGLDSDEYYDDYYIYRSRNYVDAGNHFTPSKGYYVNNGNTYYYLSDYYGYRYGDGDKSGWYLYDDNSGSWDYYCDKDDHDALGDELWYYDEDYRVGDDYDRYKSGDVYNFTAEEQANWNATNFSDTEWYQAAEEAEAAADAAYEEYKSENSSSSSSSWDNDSSYDWDSSDSWDSDSTDWGSDW